LIFIPQIAFLFMFISRRKWLYEQWFSWWIKSCENLVYRAKCGAYFWNCLCYSCYNGHKKHRKLERTTDILVTPFTTCSARLPVYAIIMHLLFWRTLVWFLEHARHDLNVALLTGFEWQFFCLFWIKF
jgi:ferrous iron transport protein B